MREILVVGGGPSGLTAATEAALAGAEVTVVEEDKEIGRPDHCAGLVSREGLQKILGGYECVLLSRIRRVRVFSPRGRMYEITTSDEKAAVIDREKFDKELMKRAERAGVEILTGTLYDPSMNFKVIINAEGTKSRVAQSIGLEVPRSIPAAQVDVEVKNFEDDVVEIYTGGWAPGFFAWTVPRRDHLRVGLAAGRGLPKELLNKFMEKNEGFANKLVTRVLRELYGKVVVGGPIKATVKGKAVSVGDAGGFAKPTTGGGVILGCLTAKLAGVAAAGAIKGSSLSEFERRWKALYWRDFERMRLAAKIFRNMREEELERAMAEAYSGGLLDKLAGYDMDLQGSVIAKIARSRLVRYAVLPLLRSLFEE
ncbi:MAG: NAD(P)/FAD-dependent oxidoreductase [Candidatus Methanomethyliaceae archaeon]|nr:NAD(P)/FAD-dependent oxidoreductase [Candidatus Methanomethyliaceae archaeon]